MTTSLVPFRPRLANLWNEFDREWSRVIGGLSGNETDTDLTTYQPEMNLAESDDAYMIELDIPGIRLEEVNVEFMNGVLTISGERSRESEESGTNWHRVESSFGRFRRMIRLTDAVDSEHIDAQYRDGVLRVRVPKSEAAKPHRIEVHC